MNEEFEEAVERLAKDMNMLQCEDCGACAMIVPGKVKEFAHKVFTWGIDGGKSEGIRLERERTLRDMDNMQKQATRDDAWNRLYSKLESQVERGRKAGRIQ